VQIAALGELAFLGIGPQSVSLKYSKLPWSGIRNSFSRVWICGVPHHTARRIRR
jgi:hypothetical protein